MQKILMSLLIFSLLACQQQTVDKKTVKTENDGAETVYCIQDVKQCPDGSYVSRKPPKCEFAACPTNERKVIEEK